MFELLAPAISVAANGQLIWSGLRGWRTKNRIPKWSGAGLTDLLSTIATTIGVLLIVGAFGVSGCGHSLPQTMQWIFLAILTCAMHRREHLKQN